MLVKLLYFFFFFLVLTAHFWPMYVEVKLYSCTFVALLLLAIDVFWSTDYVFGALHTVFWLLLYVRTEQTCWQPTLKITDKFAPKKNFVPVPRRCKLNT